MALSSGWTSISTPPTPPCSRPSAASNIRKPTMSTEGLQLRSLVKKSGELELSLVSVPVPDPAEDEVVVRIEAAPINPSDLGLLLGAADMSTAKLSGTKDLPVVTATIPERLMRAMTGRLDES